MNNPEITSYIEKELAAGHDVNAIAAQLRATGWAEKDIQASFAAMPNVAVPLQAPAAPQMINGKAMTPENIAKLKRNALIASIASIVLFALILAIFKYVFVAIGLIGVYAAIVGVRLKYLPPVIIGGIGAALNLIVYVISSVTN